MRNFVIQLLESGKALCAKNFPLFVDAWNWMNQSLANLRGDYDLTPDEGYISVDDKLGFPVIRLMNVDKLKSGGGGGGGDISGGCWEIDSSTATSLTMKNCYLMVGGKFYVFSSTTYTATFSGEAVIALRVNATGEYGAAVVVFNSISALVAACNDMTKYYSPLYRVTTVDGEQVINDLRNIPTFSMVEF